jgi:deoxyxylulose-5-phosphate synthase
MNKPTKPFLLDSITYLPDAFIEQGTREELLALCGLDNQGILKQINEFVGN